MKRSAKEWGAFLFDFDEFHFVIDKILQIIYFMLCAAMGSVLTVYMLLIYHTESNVDMNVFFSSISEVFLADAFQLFALLALMMIVTVLIIRLGFLGIGKLIETKYVKKSEEDVTQ